MYFSVTTQNFKNRGKKLFEILNLSESDIYTCISKANFNRLTDTQVDLTWLTVTGVVIDAINTDLMLIACVINTIINVCLTGASAEPGQTSTRKIVLWGGRCTNGSVAARRGKTGIVHLHTHTHTPVQSSMA